MGSYVIRLKLLPKDVGTEQQKMADDLASVLPKGAVIRNQRSEPIAFGLSALIVDVVAPEEEGIIDRVEQSISGVPLIGQYEMVGVSRMSSRIPGKS